MAKTNFLKAFKDRKNKKPVSVSSPSSTVNDNDEDNAPVKTKKKPSLSKIFARFKK